MSKDPLNTRLHDFDVLCNNMEITHYLIDPGKPAQNGRVERSRRTDQQKFYDELEFKSFEEFRSACVKTSSGQVGRAKSMSAEALAKEKKGVGGRNPSATLRTSFLLALAFAASFF